MTKIVTRLIVIGILTTLCIGVMIGSVILINQRSIQDGYLINIAGKERMLTQKITKEVFIINSQNQQNFDELNLAIKEFEENLHTLRYGNQKKNINPPSNSTIIKQLALIEKQWLEFKKVVQDFKEVSYKFCKNKLFLDENNSIILKLSDNIVQAMVNAKMSPSVIDMRRLVGCHNPSLPKLAPGSTSSHESGRDGIQGLFVLSVLKERKKFDKQIKNT